MTNVLAGMLGVGAFVAFAPAASVAGHWLLAGLVLAALVAALVAFTVGSRGVARGRVAWLGGSVGLGGRVVAAVVIAGAFGEYVVPRHPLPAALGLVVAATAMTALALRPPAALSKVSAAVVIVVLAVFVIVCLAIEPATPAVAPPPDAPGTDDPAGLLLAAGPLFFCFLGFDRATAARRGAVLGAIAVALGVYLAVGAAALRQLGGPRLALSPAPLRDALAAADASALDPLLTAGLAVAAVAAVLGVLADIRHRIGERGVAVAGTVAAGGCLLLTPSTAIALAACLMLGHYALAGLAVRLRSDRGEGDDQRPRGERDGDAEGAAVDVSGEECAVAAVPPHRPPRGGAEAEQDAHAAEPDQADQDE